MIRSSIDLGTNTCLLLVVDENGVLADEYQVVRLGQGVDQNRKLHPDAKARTLKCLKSYSRRLHELGGNPKETVCVATSQARDSGDAQAFFESIESELGFRFQILSGDEEARASFQGSLFPEMDPCFSAIIDIGGGSTEFVCSRSDESLFSLSLDIGSVRMSERELKTDPVTDREFWSARRVIDKELDKLSTWKETLQPGTELVGVAGTVTTLASVFLQSPKFDSNQLEGVTLERGDVHRLVEELKWRTVTERMEMRGMEEGRADVILAGALILWRSMEKLGFERLRVSTRGLRYGVLNL